MVFTGEENAFRQKLLDALLPEYPLTQCYSFERMLYTPKRGWFHGILFPGYVFIGLEELNPVILAKLKTIKGFCKLLQSNQSPTQIKGAALNELKFLMTTGGMLGVSTVEFLPDQTIKVVSGPLQGYEGNIVCVNKKRKQITVRSLLTEDGRTFDLKYEDVERVGS